MTVSNVNLSLTRFPPNFLYLFHTRKLSVGDIGANNTAGKPSVGSSRASEAKTFTGSRHHRILKVMTAHGVL